MSTQTSSRVRFGSPRLAPSAPAPLSEEAVTDLTKLFQILADRSRLRIILILSREGEQNVTSLCARLGQSQPAVSHHLTRMRRRGLLTLRRQGKHNFYSLEPGRLSQLLEPLLSEVAVPRQCR